MFARVSTRSSVPRGPYTRSSRSRPFIDIDWMSPGSPRKWSPWKWVRNTRVICMNERFESMNCRCVPSPQSNRRTSGPRFTAIAETFLFGVGHEPLVPRKTMCTRAESRVPLSTFSGCAPPWRTAQSLNEARPIAGGGGPLLAIDGESLTLEEVVHVARARGPVRLSPPARRRVEASHAALLRIVKAGRVAYGVTTGFGQLENVLISAKDARKLQENLVRSHAAGTGPPLREEEVRAAMLIRANALAKGYSGVRPVVVDHLVRMLNAGVHPVVPSRGSLGASGDLAPLAHIALVMIGEGEAVVRGRRMGGRAALRAARLRPLQLEAKEGLAVLNGTAVMAGLGCLLVADALQLLKDAEIAASMSFEALRGTH